jgi:hypothetical protein
MTGDFRHLSAVPAGTWSTSLRPNHRDDFLYILDCFVLFFIPPFLKLRRAAQEIVAHVDLISLRFGSAGCADSVGSCLKINVGKSI